MALGGRNADEPYVTCARIFSAIYFFFFFAISKLPYYIFYNVLLPILRIVIRSIHVFVRTVYEILTGKKLKWHDPKYLEKSKFAQILNADLKPKQARTR